MAIFSYPPLANVHTTDTGDHAFDGDSAGADTLKVGLGAFLVAEGSGEEIPFGFEYVELDPPHLVTLGFEEPREVVTVTLADDGEEGVDLTYTLRAWPAPTDEEASRRGVEDMLDRIEDGIGLGRI